MRLSKSDLFFTLSVFIVSALFFKLFIDDINAISTKNAESAATIIFKKNNAQRQFSSSLKWERLKNQSPVYNGDTLRTGNNSEAALFFEDGTKLDLADNTLIQIRSALKNNTVDFFGGNMSFKSNNKSDKSTVINTPDGSKINLSKDAVASLIQSGDKLFIGLDTGKASIEKDGASQDIDKNKEFAINIESGEITVTNRKIFPITPEPDSRYIAIAKNSVKISFVCESEEIDNVSEAFVELSPNPDFEESVISIKANYQDKKVSSDVDTPDGGWFWRVKLITGNETIYSSA
ncbi:MAG TPA: FecR domain-containing protein, partial [Spirochaetota bacterium]|nr:FecR domain-containing protein [Spirochaetota bacterium]